MTELIIVAIITSIAAFALGWQSGASRERMNARLDRYIGRL